jgi:hypothetical protein
MTTDQLLQLLIRLLPSIIVLALGFVAVSDQKTRERWTSLLYQLGSLRPEQRSDANIQKGVRIPFFIVAALLLIWPINYYRHITRVFEISPTAYGPNTPKFNPYGNNAASATPGAADNTAAGAVATPMPGSVTAPTIAAPTFSPYGSSTPAPQ